MDLSIIDTFLLAPFAPLLGLLLFWFTQLILSESLKHLMRKIWNKHRAFCRFSNFIALLFQSISHALGYTLTGTGVGEFSVSVSGAKVEPKREKKGFALFVADLFLVMGPFFIPPVLIFLILLPFLSIQVQGSCGSFSSCFISFGSMLQGFGLQFLGLLANLDMFNPFHIIFLIIILMVGLGIRPSFIESEERRVGMIEDLAKIKEMICSHYIFIILILLLFFSIYYLSYFSGINIYTLMVSFLGWLSLISVISLLLAHILVLLIISSDRVGGMRGYLLFLIPIVSYLICRSIFHVTNYGLSIPTSNAISIIVTLFTVILVFKVKTNKLKIGEEMVAGKERKDEDRE